MPLGSGQPLNICFQFVTKGSCTHGFLCNTTRHCDNASSSTSNPLFFFKRILKGSHKNTRMCPNCSMRVEKLGGCPSMTCAACKRSFNWTEMVNCNGNAASNHDPHEAFRKLRKFLLLSSNDQPPTMQLFIKEIGGLRDSVVQAIRNGYRAPTIDQGIAWCGIYRAASSLGKKAIGAKWIV